MKTSTQKTKLPQSDQTVKVKTRSDSKCKKMPSGNNCLVCFNSMLGEIIKDSYLDMELNREEIISRMKSKIDELKRIPIALVPAYIAILENNMKAEKEKLEEQKSMKKGKKAGYALDENKSNDNWEMIPIALDKGDLAKKAGFFFFNPNNKNGLHLPNIYRDPINELFCEHFKTSKGSSLSLRTTIDGLASGKNERIPDNTVIKKNAPEE